MLDKVEGELLAFSETCKKSLLFSTFLNNPTVPKEVKYNQVCFVCYEIFYVDINWQDLSMFLVEIYVSMYMRMCNKNVFFYF